MKISKQILLLTPILIIIFVSGCSKNLFPGGDEGPGSGFFGIGSTLEGVEKKSGEGNGVTSPAEESADRSFGTAKQEMPGDGSTGSFSAEPFAAGVGDREDETGLRAEASPAEPEEEPGFIREETVKEGDAFSGPVLAPLPDRSFGTAEQGMPGDGSTGSFSAEPFAAGVGDREDETGLRAEASPAEPEDEREFIREETVAEADAFSGPVMAPPPDRSFGTAEQGMPGDGSTGSFSAEPFVAGVGDREEEGGLRAEASPAEPEEEPGFIREETVKEAEPFTGPDFIPFADRSFGTAEKGMPGNGAAGSFVAKPFTEEGTEAGDADKAPEIAFLPGKDEEDEKGCIGDCMVVPLDQGEEARRFLPYRPTDDLRDIHFAFDKYDLDTLAKGILKENVAYLKTHPRARIEIQGYCDERGSNSYNISLGDRRARSTKSFLVSQGIDESRIRTISYGEERPFCFESNEECWYLNRRAHFLVAE